MRTSVPRPRPGLPGLRRPLAIFTTAMAALTAGTLLVLVLLSGCAGIRQTVALRQVDFWLDGVRDVNLAGIRIAGIQSLNDFSASEGALLLSAYGARALPLRLVLDVAADNPPDNPDARLTGLEWSLLVRETETVEGVVTGPVPLPSGRTTSFPIAVEIDLMRYFQASDLPELVELAASIGRVEAARLAGAREDPGPGALVPVALLARPVIETPAGPIRYPGLIRIAVR